MGTEQTNCNRWVRIFGAVSLGAIFVLLVLVFAHKSTMVELTLRVNQLIVTVLPPHLPHTAISLFDEAVKVHSLQWKGAELLEYGSQRIPLQEDPESIIELRGKTPFQSVLKLHSEMRLGIQAYRKDRLMINLAPKDPEQGGWQNRVHPSEIFQLRLRDIKVPPKLGLQWSQDDSWSFAQLASHGPPFFLTGGQREAQLNFQLERRVYESTILRIIDIQPGQISEPKPLPLRLPQEYVFLPLGNQVALLQKNPEKPHSERLFSANLSVREPKFYRLRGFEGESFLLGGHINFPAEEKTRIELKRDLFLAVSSAEPFKLKSIRLEEGDLELTLWGKPSSITLGPTLELMEELLPSWFIWLYTHQTSTFIFSTIVWFCITSVSFLKMVGVLKS